MRSTHKIDAGFSLLELLIAMVIMLIVTGAAFSAMTYLQKSTASSNLRAEMHSSMRAALELMTQEIGQAGSLNFTPKTLSAAVTANSAAQAVTLNSTTGIFVGEILVIDIGTPQERVTVTAVTSSTVTGIFTKNHAIAAVVHATGVFPQGVLYDTGLAASTLSTPTRLSLAGDLLGDGTLVYAQYDCNTTAGTLSRSVTPVTSVSISASSVLIQNVIPNPTLGSTCFQYTTATSGGFTFVTSVGVTISVQSAFRDPQTQAFVTMTKSFLNIAPRNILAGLDNAQASLTNRLQALPPGMPLH